MPLPITSPWKAELFSKKLWLIAGIVLAGRLVWWLYWGTLLENDSLFYLQLSTSIYHPPLYSLFSGVILRATHLVDAVVWMQCAIYSVCAGIFLMWFVKNDKWRMMLAVALAIEPCSGKLASTIMAETIFLSVLFLAFSAVPFLLSNVKRSWIVASLWVGITLGLCHLTRYVAPVFLVSACLWLLMQRVGAKKFLFSAGLMIVAFQLVLLPMRMYNQSRFGTLQFSTFSSLSLWNSGSYLFKGSAVDDHPESKFEKFLTTFPDTTFTLKSTWFTSHIFGDYFPYQRYLRIEKLTTAEAIVVANSAGSTGLQLILHSPFRHFREFVCANVARPFHIHEHIYSEQIPSNLRNQIAFQKNPEHDYWPSLWVIYFLLLLYTTLRQFLYRGQFHRVTGILVLSCWLYLIGISLLGVIFLRFVYFLAPLIVIILGLQLDSLKSKAEE